jgi:hypothetical protein
VNILTEKENFMMLVRGEQPEWVPRYTFFPDPSGKPVPTAMIMPSFLSAHLSEPGPYKDIWGVTNVPVPEAGNAKIPEPNNFILKDIRKWRDIIKAPDLSGIDWETMAKKDLEKLNVDRRETVLGFGMHVGYFQNLMAFMGFSEGLCAMYEEPEEVKALMEYLCDFYVEFGRRCIDYYKPDVFGVTDDTAAWKNPFFSVEMYRELFKPYHARQAALGNDRGLPIEMHNCGRCEDFIDDWRDFGVVLWNPAQISNDLSAIKKKYGNSLVICGGWDIVGALSDPNVTEETVKESVYKAIDTYAPGGGYAFCGAYLGSVGDEKTNLKNKWLQEAADTYGKTFYKK